MKSVFVSLFITFFSFAAFAQHAKPKVSSKSSSKTLGMSAPHFRQHEVYAGAMIPNGTTDSSPIGQKTEYSGFNIDFGYSFGVSDFIALYALQGYKSTEYSYSNPNGSGKVNGIGDTTLGAKGIINIEKFYIYYDAAYSLALADQYRTNATTREQTAVSSRPDMMFAGGGGLSLGVFGAGGVVGYHMFQDGEAESSSGSVKTITKHKAGTGLDWKVYGQLEYNFKVGVSYEENKVDEFNVVTSGVSSIQGEATDTAITVYGIIPVGAQGEALVSAAKIDRKEATTVTYNLYYLTAALRWIF